MASMIWTNYALDTLVAPKLSALTECGAGELPPREALLPSFVLNSILRVRYPERVKKCILNTIRHVEQAGLAYEAGRTGLQTYLADRPGTRVSAYFGAVSHFETHVAHLNMARWLTCSIVHLLEHGPDNQNPVKLFTDGAGSCEERLHKLNNRIKHQNNKIMEGELPDGSTLVMWLTNVGLESAEQSVTFEELVGSMMDCYGVAHRLTIELPDRVREQVKEAKAQKGHGSTA